MMPLTEVVPGGAVSLCRCCATVKGVYRTRKASFFFIVRCLVFVFVFRVFVGIIVAVCFPVRV